MLRRALMLAFAFALVAQPALAREYYVAPNGDDGAAGTLQAPWRTVARVNSAALQPGDAVRFAAGGVWHAMLAPGASGTSAAPIIFGTYGTGRAVLDGTNASGFAGVAVNGRSSLVFEHLVLRGWLSGNQGVYLAGAHSVLFQDVVVDNSAEGFHQSPSAPSTGVTIDHSRVSRIDGGGGTGVGINVTTGTSGWRVTATVIENVADSCVIDQGTGSVYDGISVTNCGFGGLTYGTHGLYLKGPGQTLRNSTVRHAYTNCVSVRFQDATISGNTVSDCPIGIAWFESATAPGTVTIVRNRISDATTGIYVDSSPTQSFRVSQNTIIGGRRSGGKTDGIVSNDAAGLAITNNIAAGALRKLIDVSGTAASAYVDRGNALYAPGATYAWNGRYVTSASAFAGLTGQGAGDMTVDPRLRSTKPSAPDFALASNSPVRDLGVRDPAGLALSAGCDGAADHYCGSAPEPGAIELGAVAGSGARVDTGTPAPAGVPSPDALAAAVRGSAVTLTWRAPGTSVASYLVAAAGGAATTVTATRAVVRGLHAGRTYTFTVTAVDAAAHRSPPAMVRVRVPAALRAAQIRPRLVAAGRHGVVIAIPRAVTAATLRVAGRVLHVHGGRVRIARLAARHRYVLRLTVARPGQRPLTAALRVRTR